MPTWICSYADGKYYRVRNKHLRAATHLMNPNQKLTSFFGERKKINNAKQANGCEQFISNDACTEKVAKAMDKANERLFKGFTENDTEKDTILYATTTS